MKDTKEKILKGSFQLFLKHNYEKVTVPELEKATGISRGGIFHHTGNKKNLFIEVVNKYLFELHDVQQKFSVPEECTLQEFIEIYTKSIDNTAKYVHSVTEIKETELTNYYYHFVLQASKYHPDFLKFEERLMINELALWTRIIKKAQESGEVKKELDTTALANQFYYYYYGISYITSYFGILNTEELRKQYVFLYELVKA
ncbi:MAG: TetR/AcrR family transcriptional regulator [Bacteroides sp.]|nr:TetR/AcrR family transcriptional regulator [Bacteroides sp.]